jgi:hypothetical protein
MKRLSDVTYQESHQPYIDLVNVTSIPEMLHNHHKEVLDAALAI